MSGPSAHLHDERRPRRGGGLGCGVADFIGKLSIGAPTVSHHVKALVDAGLIRVEKQGKYVSCFLNEDLYRELGDFFRPLSSQE